MATRKRKSVKAAIPAQELFKIGDRVLIHHFGGQQGRIVEYRGPLGPGGAHVYRVRVRRKPTSDYIELRADQIERIELEA
jgi:hypothetical protein